MRTEKEKMLTGELYRPGDLQIQADLEATKAWLARYNAVLERSADEQRALLRERLAAVGAGCVVRPPFTATMASTSGSARACSSTSTASSSTWSRS